MNKVVVIGTGFVGSSIAYAINLRNQANEVVLINRELELSIGEMWDINHGYEALGHSRIVTGDYSMISDADLIIISAGRNRKPGETRIQLAFENAQIIKAIGAQIKQQYVKGTIVVVTNPVDVCTQLLEEVIDSPDIQIMGSGTLLDTSRLRYALRESYRDESRALLIGEHGDGIIPLFQSFHPQERFISDKSFQEEVMTYVRGMGSKIIANKGKTHFGIATSISYLIELMSSDEPVLTVLSIPLKGKLGIQSSISVPVMVSQNRIELYLEIISSSELDELLQVSRKLEQVLNEIRH